MSVCIGAIVLSDLGVVVAFLGALLGSFVIYVHPNPEVATCNPRPEPPNLRALDLNPKPET